MDYGLFQMINTIRVLLVDDHTLFREGLGLILDAEPDFEVVGEAEDGQAAVEKACRLQPDLILMDITMPGGDGIEATRTIKRRQPEVIVVILTGQRDRDKVVEALLAGASGYLSKNMRAVDLLEVLRGTWHGKTALPSLLNEQTLQAYRREYQAESLVDEKFTTLTQREQEIVRLVGTGASDREIAHALQLSLNTVKTHIRHILCKLQVKSRREVAQVERQVRQHDDKN
jgi:DNA-binding NarL/FixJ family response regulator